MAGLKLYLNKQGLSEKYMIYSSAAHRYVEYWSIRKTAEALSITFNTASSAIKRLTDAGILVQTTNASRNRTFAYEDYLSILRKGT